MHAPVPASSHPSVPLDTAMPPLVRSAGVLALVGGGGTATGAVVTLVIVAAGDDRGDPLIQLAGLFAAVLLALGAAQSWAAVRLLRGRSWLPVVLTALPALSVFRPSALAAPSIDLFLLLGPGASLVALGLALTPTTHRWVATTRTARERGPR